MKNLTYLRAFCLLVNQQKLAVRVKIAELLLRGAQIEEIAIFATDKPECQALQNFFQQKNFAQEYEKCILRWQSAGIEILALTEVDYPASVRELSDPPLLLFYQGDLSLLTRAAVSLIGARRAEAFSMQFAQQLAQDLALKGLVVVSGLAYGIDAAAHRGALAAGSEGKTIAVLGSGIQKIYPAGNFQLAQNIVKSGGLLLSQFLPDEAARKYHFLNRNRIIAALGRVLCVVQVAKKSGSLSTANFAMEQGRDLLVLPSDVRKASFAGSIELLKGAARAFSCASDVLEYYSDCLGGCTQSARTAQNLSQSGLSKAAQKIMMQLVNCAEIELEDLLSIDLELSVGEVHLALIELELAGLICQLDHGKVAIVAK